MSNVMNLTLVILGLLSAPALADIWQCQSMGKAAQKDCVDNQLGGCEDVGATAAAACYIAYIRLPERINYDLSCEVKAYEASRICAHNIQEGISCDKVASSFYGMCKVFSQFNKETNHE